MPVGKDFFSRIAFLLLMLPVVGIAQDIQVQIYAETDSVQIGIPFRVRVSVTHRADLPVIFPDTSAYTTPYDIYAIEPEDAVTKDSLSTDARTYLLQSFEVEPVQYITIPIGVVSGKDTIWVTPEPDSVQFVGMISILPEKPKPLRHSGFYNVDDQIDPFELTVFIVAVASALTLLGFALRKPVMRMLYRWRCKRVHQHFYRELVNLSGGNLSQPEFLHQAGLLVRRYFETRVHDFLPSFSTSEFTAWMRRHPEIAADDQDFLTKIQLQGDLALYAGIEPSGLNKEFVIRRVGGIFRTELSYRLTQLPV